MNERSEGVYQAGLADPPAPYTGLRGYKMSKKTKVKRDAKPYYTIGVRFLDGPRIAKVYTYKVHGRYKVTLGQELVADTPHCPAVVAVVRIDSTPQDTDPSVDYKFIHKKVANL